jgi:hypothetical protein
MAAILSVKAPNTRYISMRLREEPPLSHVTEKSTTFSPAKSAETLPSPRLISAPETAGKHATSTFAFHSLENKRDTNPRKKHGNIPL